MTFSLASPSCILKVPIISLRRMLLKGGTGNGEGGTGNGERGTGSRELESGNDCTALIPI